MANTNAHIGVHRRKGKFWPQYGGPKFNLEAILNQPCPKHSRLNRPSTHVWKDCSIMRKYGNASLHQDHNNGNGPHGRSDPSSHGSGFGGGGSNSDFQGQGNQGGYNQQPNQGNQQQQSGYQSNPKQLSSGHYHVFTTSLCKRDQKIHK